MSSAKLNTKTKLLTLSLTNTKQNSSKRKSSECKLKIYTFYTP